MFWPQLQSFCQHLMRQPVSMNLGTRWVARFLSVPISPGLHSKGLLPMSMHRPKGIMSLNKPGICVKRYSTGVRTLVLHVFHISLPQGSSTFGAKTSPITLSSIPTRYSPRTPSGTTFLGLLSLTSFSSLHLSLSPGLLQPKWCSLFMNLAPILNRDL